MFFYLYIYICIYLIQIHSCKAEQQLQGMELQEKMHKKLKQTGNHFRKIYS